MGTNMRFMLFYSVEMASTGLVSPMPPFIRTQIFDRYPVDIAGYPEALLIFFFFTLNTEICELIWHGPKFYFLRSGWSNFIDWLAILSAFTTFIQRAWTIGTRPQADMAYESGLWAQAKQEAAMQIWLGFFLFCMLLKCLTYTSGIPIMNSIGHTFHLCFVPICCFGVVMSVLLCAFAMLFNAIFCTTLPQYGTFSDSIRTVVLDGLMGAIDSGELDRAAPNLGSLVYGAFLFVVLFTGFTIVIAIITDSYEEAKEKVTHDKFIRRGLDYVAESLPAAEDMEDSDSDEEGEDKPGEDEEEPDMRAVMAMMKQLAGRMERIEQNSNMMKQLAGRMERIEQKLDRPAPVRPVLL